VKGGPTPLHFLVRYDWLIGLALEVESFEGWHAVMLSLGTSILGSNDALQI
jgi:hypothetical protein